LKNITLTSKNPEIRNIWPVTRKELIGCFLQELVEVETVGCMTCCVDRLRPKSI
jgi:hypothetical protein